MTEGISLTKRTEAAGVSLQKAAERATEDLGDVNLQCTLEIDYSGSMASFYTARTGGIGRRMRKSGVSPVQETVERVLGFILTGLDPDGIVPVNFYHGGLFDTIDVSDGSKPNTENYVGVVERFQKRNSMGGTAYAPPIQRALDTAAADTTGYPFLHIFVTDGEPGDRVETERLLVSSRTTKNFFQFIQFGTDSGASRYLDNLNNNLTGDGIDNIGVTKYASPHDVTDEDFYDQICSEVLPIWLPKARAAGYAK